MQNVCTHYCLGNLFDPRLEIQFQQVLKIKTKLMQNFTQIVTNLILKIIKIIHQLC